jgi:hypothetical protein
MLCREATSFGLPLSSVPVWPAARPRCALKLSQTHKPSSIVPTHRQRTPNLTAWPPASSIVVCHLPKSAKHMLVVEFADLEIGSAAERYRTSMAKYPPKPLRTLYRGGRARAVNRFTSSNAAAIIEIKRQCHEKSDFGHTFALL